MPPYSPTLSLPSPRLPVQGKIPGWDAPKGKPKPTFPSGILAHCDFSEHADGRFPLEYIHFNQTSSFAS